MSENDQLYRLYRQLTSTDPERVSAIPGSGSNRRYFRLGGDENTLIGAFNSDLKENSVFVSFTRTFLVQGLPVPRILAESADGYAYLLDDLGDTTLFGFLQEQRRDQSAFPVSVKDYYKRILSLLPEFQVKAKPDYRLCYPRDTFDRQSMLWDLNYFKYYYLKLAAIPFDEQQLENDFNAFASFLLEVPQDYFMYRDFQSRNVMLFKEQPWFIDYQGGRRGALQYDVVSMLYDAKADIPGDTRQELLEHYLHTLSNLIHFDQKQFLKYYPGFILVRILQAMGAYGFRGYYEKKQHFLQSIPYALRNLETIRTHKFLKSFPELERVIGRMIDAPLPAGIVTAGSVSAEKGLVSLPETGKTSTGLTVKVTSFSYKRGIPQDVTGNGGGFVFDCRALPNPGRYEEYQQITGKDPAVIEFLGQKPDVEIFLNAVFSLVDQSVTTYLERSFTNLMVSFGCTGGQHRSVYCAEAMAGHLRKNFSVKVELHHREQE